MDFSDIACAFSPGITTIDSHTEGESTRLIVDGTGEIPGASMIDKLDYLKTSRDSIRRSLTREPRGHTGILAALLTEPVSRGAAFGLIYMDARRYPYLCGHATIGAVVTLHRTGMLDLPQGTSALFIDTPSGIMEAEALVRDGRIESVTITMVPSFVFATDQTIHVDGYGDLTIDLVCTGGFFAMVSSDAIGMKPVLDNREFLTDLGMKIIEAANQQLDVSHPERPEVSTVDVTEFYDSALDPASPHGRGMVVYGEAHVDRSPCGTGTAAKLTLLHHYGHIDVGREYLNYSPIDTCFAARIIGLTRIGDREACKVSITGSAHVTGIHHFVFQEEDPLKQGFII